MLAIEMRRWFCGYEELGAIGVRPTISHGEQKGLPVFLVQVLIIKHAIID